MSIPSLTWCTTSGDFIKIVQQDLVLYVEDQDESDGEYGIVYLPKIIQDQSHLYCLISWEIDGNIHHQSSLDLADIDAQRRKIRVATQEECAGKKWSYDGSGGRTYNPIYLENSPKRIDLFRKKIRLIATK